MLTLDQVRALEARVEKAVGLIAALRGENSSLRASLADAEKRVAELEVLVEEFQKDQARIEEGIVEALRKLDAFEDGGQVQAPAMASAEAKPQREPARPAAGIAPTEPVLEGAGLEASDTAVGQDLSDEPGPSDDLDIF